MKKISNSEEAIQLIIRYQSKQFASEAERDLILDFLEDYQPGTSNILTQGKVRYLPEEALRLAREKNKPIIL